MLTQQLLDVTQEKINLLIQFDAKLAENRELYYASEKYKHRSKQLGETMLEMSQDLFESQHGRVARDKKTKKKKGAEAEIEAILAPSFTPKTQAQRMSISGAEILQAHGLPASMVGKYIQESPDGKPVLT